MIYDDGTIEYKVKFYKDVRKNRIPVLEYLESLNKKETAKILRYIEFLRTNKGYLDEPYSRHVKGKIRELRIDFGKNRHRIFYFIFIKKTIILLHGFLKKTAKTPISEIKRAKENYRNVLRESKAYE